MIPMEIREERDQMINNYIHGFVALRPLETATKPFPLIHFALRSFNCYYQAYLESSSKQVPNCHGVFQF